MSNFFTNYDRPPKVCKSFLLPSKTRQQFKDEADINHLVARYMRTGSYYDPLQVTAQRRPPEFADYSELGDFREQQQKILNVFADFASLPATIRERFGNNPALFVEFAGNPKNVDSCVKLGIFKAEKVEPIVAPAAEPVNTGDGTAVANPLTPAE